MPRDGQQTSEHADAATGEAERVYRCARCGHEITRGRWEIRMGGEHERTLFNPAGVVFRVLCFGEAPGAADASPPVPQFTWFPGYAWRIAVCRGCAAHLGWRYEGGADPPVFFGLIRPALTVG